MTTDRASTISIASSLMGRSSRNSHEAATTYRTTATIPEATVTLNSWRPGSEPRVVRMSALPGPSAANRKARATTKATPEPANAAGPISERTWPGMAGTRCKTRTRNLLIRSYPAYSASLARSRLQRITGRTRAWPMPKSITITGRYHGAKSEGASASADVRCGPRFMASIGQLSPDGSQYWDGQRWAPVLSADGQWAWDGAQWKRIAMPAAPGQQLATRPAYSAAAPPPQPTFQYANPIVMYKAPTNSAAVASLVFGIVSWFLCPLVGGI